MLGRGPAAKLEALVGREIALSDWMTVDQARIDAFAECTGDKQWIHVDVERARKGPLGGTVAHGFLLLALLPRLGLTDAMAALKIKIRCVVHYGLNRVRFVAPVPAGARVRNRALLKSFERKGLRRLLVTVESTLELEGASKPALVAETLVLCVL
jgi:acyl dehydratase